MYQIDMLSMYNEDLSLKTSYLSLFDYGGLNLAVFRKFLCIFISTCHNETHQVNFWSSGMVYGIQIL